MTGPAEETSDPEHRRTNPIPGSDRIPGTHPFADLPDRGKQPTSKRNLDAWVSQAVGKVGVIERRLSWLVASSVVMAALQRAQHDDGLPRFLLKGGAYLEVRLGLRARSTADVDTMFRGTFDDFLEVLDSCLRPWGALELSRTEVATIDRARRVVKPRRFAIKLAIAGTTWRSIDVEVAPDEGHVGDRVELVPGAPLDHFGLPSATELAGIAMDYQVAQKLHACSDPHLPPDQVNDRARDVVDLLLIREAFYNHVDDVADLQAACIDLFNARHDEAEALELTPRTWPPTVIAYRDWSTDFASASADTDLDYTLVDAVTAVNQWITQIEAFGE